MSEGKVCPLSIISGKPLKCFEKECMFWSEYIKTNGCVLRAYFVSVFESNLQVFDDADSYEKMHEKLDEKNLYG